MADVLPTGVASFGVPDGVRLRALHWSRWWEPMSALSRPGREYFLPPLRGNRAPVTDRAGKVWAPASRIPWVLGLVPVAVSGTQEVHMSLLTLVTVSMAE